MFHFLFSLLRSDHLWASHLQATVCHAYTFPSNGFVVLTPQVLHVELFFIFLNNKNRLKNNNKRNVFLDYRSRIYLRLLLSTIDPF